MVKHKHEYKMVGETDVSTGRWLISTDPLSPAVMETKSCLVFICHCGDMLIKPKPTPENETERRKDE